tara:strand:- start:35 stop:619 length:585 start_codon:yes stop_codon:yes gene_type:complete
MKDYEVTVRVRNNWLLSAMKRAGIDSLAELARRSGASYNTIMNIASFKYPILTRRGWSPSAIKISEALKCLPEDLVPPAHIEQALAKNKGVFTADYAEVQALLTTTEETNPFAFIEKREQSEAVGKAVGNLSEREQTVINMRYGLAGERENTLEEVAAVWGVSRERVSQLEMKALRKMRHPAKSKPLKGFLNDY